MGNSAALVRLSTKFLSAVIVTALLTIVLLIAFGAEAAGAEDCNANGIPDLCDTAPLSGASCAPYARLDDSVKGSESCASAPLIAPGFYYRGSTAGKAHEGHASCAKQPAGALWFKLVTPPTGFVHVSLGGTFKLPRGFDSIVSVYDSCGLGARELDCANNSGCREEASTPRTSWLDPAVGISAVPGSTIYVRVSGYAEALFKNSEGDFLLYVDDRCMQQRCPSGPAGESADCNMNGLPDECDLTRSGADCNANGKLDSCEKLLDCDGNGKADACESAVQVVFADRQPGAGAGDSLYGISGPLKQGNLSVLFDLMGERYSTEIPEPQETASEDYNGPSFECSACAGAYAVQPFGLFLSDPAFSAGGLQGGGVYHGDGIYHLYRPAAGGSESRGRLLMLDSSACGLAAVGSGNTGFWAELAGLSGATGAFKACFSFPLDNLGSAPFIGQPFKVSGSYDRDGLFVGKGLLDGNQGCPTYSKNIYVSGRFVQPAQCSDCNQNGIGDAADLEAGTSQDCNANQLPDECEPDGDGDGVIDACDLCPRDPGKKQPGVCGCGIEETLDCGGTITVDCFGVPGGAAKADRCGVCNGDGGSYLGCLDITVADAAASAVQAVKSQARYAQQLLRRVKGGTCAVSKKQTNRLRAAAASIVKGWPVTARSCSNSTYCIETALQSTKIDLYQRNVAALYRLSRRAAQCVLQSSTGGVCSGPIAVCRKSLQNIQRENRALVKKARQLARKSLEATLGVPTSTSVCCDEIPEL